MGSGVDVRGAAAHMWHRGRCTWRAHLRGCVHRRPTDTADVRLHDMRGHRGPRRRRGGEAGCFMPAGHRLQRPRVRFAPFTCAIRPWVAWAPRTLVGLWWRVTPGATLVRVRPSGCFVMRCRRVNERRSGDGVSRLRHRGAMRGACFLKRSPPTSPPPAVAPWLCACDSPRRDKSRSARWRRRPAAVPWPGSARHRWCRRA